MATSPIKQLRTGQRIQGGILLTREHGMQTWDKIGPVGSVQLTITPTEVTSTSDESGKTMEIGSWIVGGEASISIADIQMRTPTIEEAIFLSKTIYATQTASTEELVLEDVAVGKVLRIEGIRPTVVLTDNVEGGISYDEDVDGTGEGHYIYQSGRGILEITKLPPSAGTSVKIAVTKPEITETDKVIRRQIFKTAGKRVELLLLGAVAESAPGIPEDYHFPDVLLRGEGAITLKGTDGVNVGAINAKVYEADGGFYGTSAPYIEV